VRLVAGCDVDPARAQGFAAQFGCRAYTDVVQMLERERPDIVDVCTPETAHVEPVVTALDAGCHVLCEKPMAGSLEGGQRMLAAAERSGRFLGVDYNYRFMPAFERMRGMIASGELGQFGFLAAVVHSYCFHHALDLMRFLGGEVSGVMAQYTHTEDPRYHFRVQLPDFVYCPSRNEAAILRFQHGGLASITGSRFENLEWNMLRVDYLAERGKLVADAITTSNVVGRLTRWPGAEAVPLYDGERVGFSLAFRRSIAAFVEAVREGRPPPVTGHDGLRALELEAAIVRSQATGRYVAL
jgi:predicted dehydrogenase